MSLSGISSSSLFSYETQNQNQNKLQQFQQEFQQLGEDLQSGNLSAAQTDFATLQQMAPQGTSSTSSTSSNPLEQAFQQLGQDLQSGNISAAQQDYSNIQQDFQSQAQHAHGHHHHHSGDDNNSEMSQISQAFQQLGQALQSGNLSTAQQAYTTLQQEIQQLGGNNASTPAQGTAISGVSVSA
jgi:outer membrane protein assembly factor BamD (BamD/ComL family)